MYDRKLAGNGLSPRQEFAW